MPEMTSNPTSSSTCDSATVASIQGLGLALHRRPIGRENELNCRFFQNCKGEILTVKNSSILVAIATIGDESNVDTTVVLDQDHLKSLSRGLLDQGHPSRALSVPKFYDLTVPSTGDTNGFTACTEQKPQTDAEAS
jgi:hypothetical protein